MIVCAALVGAMSLARLDNPIPIYSVVDKDFFPFYWRTADISPSATKITSSELGRSIDAVTRAVAKYPEGLLEKNLKGIYLCRKLSFFGLPYGGTNSDSGVYLANDGIENGFTDEYLEGAFHHEFSSILLRNYRAVFPEAQWTACLPLNFEYRGDGTSSVREGTAGTTYDRKLNSRGFLTEYSTSSMEEDFNMIAEAVMVGNPEFWRACERYPALERKANLVVEFYGRLDQGMSPSKIKSFSRAR